MDTWKIVIQFQSLKIKDLNSAQFRIYNLNSDIFGYHINAKVI